MLTIYQREYIGNGMEGRIIEVQDFCEKIMFANVFWNGGTAFGVTGDIPLMGIIILDNKKINLLDGYGLNILGTKYILTCFIQS